MSSKEKLLFLEAFSHSINGSQDKDVTDCLQVHELVTSHSFLMSSTGIQD